ncbi:MAG: hypothetical protein AB7V42_15620 [Thermoleophilia bacterium]
MAWPGGVRRYDRRMHELARAPVDPQAGRPRLLRAGGHMWLAAGRRLMRRTPAVAATVRTPFPVVSAVAVGGTIWVAGGEPHRDAIAPARLIGVDAGDGRVVAPVRRLPRGATGDLTAAPGGRLWASSDEGLLLIDPARPGRVIRRSPEGGSAVAGEGALWTLDGGGDELVRLDPATGGRTGALRLPHPARLVQTAAGLVIVNLRSSFLAVDPVTLAIRWTRAVPEG